MNISEQLAPKHQDIAVSHPSVLGPALSRSGDRSGNKPPFVTEAFIARNSCKRGFAMFSRTGRRISSTHPAEADSRIGRNYRREPLASTQLYGLTVSPGRHTHECFSSSASVNVAGSVMVIV